MKTPRLPAEILIVVVILAVLGASAMGRLREMQATTSIARVHSDLAWLRQGVFLYQADQAAYPRMSWPSAVPGYSTRHGDQPTTDTYQPTNDPMQYSLTSALTTPVAYLSRFDLRDPWSPDTYRFAPLYRYYAPWCLDRLVGLGTLDSLYAIDSSTIRLYSGEFRLLSIGPKGNPDLAWHNDVPTQDTLFFQYDPTNGVGSAGTIYVSERDAEPIQRRY